jgi:hypothetical protein
MRTGKGTFTWADGTTQSGLYDSNTFIGSLKRQ